MLPGKQGGAGGSDSILAIKSSGARLLGGDAAYAECRQLLVAGKLDLSGKRSSAGIAAAAGAGTAAVGGATAAAVGGYAGLAAASATIVLLPFAIMGGAWGMSKVKRAKNERAIKAAMEGCLGGRGYEVAGWSTNLEKPVAHRAAPRRLAALQLESLRGRPEADPARVSYGWDVDVSLVGRRP
jgi:hypothetical protein